MKRIFLNTMLIGVVLLPAVALAQVTGTFSLQNPLGSTQTIAQFLNLLLDYVLIIALPIIVVALVWAGFLFVAAQGKPDKLVAARKVILYTLLGAALILGAKVILTAISGTVSDIQRGVGLEYLQEHV